FWPSVGRDLLIYARAFIKAMPLPSVWTVQEGYPVRGPKQTAAQYLEKIRRWKESEGKFPFVIQHIPALDILPLLDPTDNVLASIEEKIVPAKLLADEGNAKIIQDLIARRTLAWYDEVSVIEYIDQEHVAYFLVDTQPRNETMSITPSP